MKRLSVYLNLECVGTLTQDASGLLGFRYCAEWLERPGAIPLSRSLPLRTEPFRGKHVRPFFAGILPDEGPRQQIAAILGVSERNDFAILERIGGECAGAVSLLPAGSPLPEAGERPLRKLSEKELKEIVGELPRRPLLAGREGLRLSLAGAQGKLPVVMEGDSIFLPLGNAASTHILKPEPERFPGLVAVEVMCMLLAKAVGLAVPTVSWRLIGDTPCLVVQRYDRKRGPDGVQRVHQEDFCQAMGFPPEHKYQQEGGPLVRECIAMLREWSSASVLDIRDFVNGLIFNMVIGNADAHGKNYSLLYDQGNRRLAPLYDLICTLAWPELSKTPAMKIGRCESMDAITLEHWEKMATESHLGKSLVRDRVTGICRAILVELANPALRQATGNAAMFDRVAGIIQGRATLLLQM